MGFWEKLKKPFFLLAPMADVTDAAFRRLIARESKISERKDVAMWTEFVSADGLFLGGFEKLSRDLVYTEEERPIVAQFFTSTPEMMEKASRFALDMGFDGVDINMGCPHQAVIKQGAGAGLIQDPEKAREVICAAKRGATSGDKQIPVSVKTRIGFNKNELEEWLPELLAEEPAAVIIHARTKKEMSAVPANWETIKRAVEIRDRLGSSSYIVGNGDVLNLADARAKAEETGADGVMLGRAIFGNPWLFRQDVSWDDVSLEKKLLTLVEHSKLFEELLGDIKSFAIMKKHYKAYVRDFPEAKELRTELMEAEDASEVEKIVENFLKKTD
jgi:nifR3 family TIM-barrel protein